MPSPVAMPLQIEQALARGWTVLTANQRAARTLRHDYDLRQRQDGLTYWQPPPILAWDTWLNSLWRTLLLDGRASDLLLSPTQEHILWRDLVAADGAANSLHPIDALAQTAADAWLLLNAYRGRARLANYESNFDTQTFRRWAGEFQRRCTRDHYLTRAELPDALRIAIAAAHIALPPGFLLVGFDSKTLAQDELTKAVKAAGTPIEEFDLHSAGVPSNAPAPHASATRELATLPSELDELAACANWLRALLKQQPDARIAVIVAETETARAEIDRVFRQILAPELNDIVAPTTSGPYEFSLGVPLASTPMVATALDLLRWANGPLSLDRVSSLLLSPHFAAGDASEYLARAEFDAFVLRDRTLLQPQISLDDLTRLVSHPARSASLPILLSHLRSLDRLFRRLDPVADHTHADWAATIHELLDAAGWAPQASLDSSEFQTRRKWESTLDELATLDFQGRRVSFNEALAALERIATETVFAAESRHAPIQIMGPLESAGSTFDAIWFLRANDEEWPSRPATNPLLPWQMQRDLGMPGATPSLDATYARHITERIALSAPTVVFSYAQESADGSQRPSPALAGLALEPCAATELAPAIANPAPIALETLPDADPIPPPPDRVHQGGAAILQSQAACGFRAFAEKRLYSSSLQATSLGLDPSERGSIVHAVLENFWAEVKTQAALKSMPQAERIAQLNRSIDAAFTENHARPEPGWPDAYLHAERDRLLTLLGQWLDYEADKRSPFIVKSREETLNDVTIGPLHLKVRVDRVDTALADGVPGGEIILDYKTGEAKPSQWLGERPDAPQLPLYAVVAPLPHLAAVAFASVRPGNLMGIAGYEAQPGVLPKASKLSTSSLTAQVNEWRTVLTSLADEFHAGNASVSPKHYPQTCQYCEQRLLCRLNLSSLEPDVLEEILDDPDPFSGLEEDELA